MDGIFIWAAIVTIMNMTKILFPIIMMSLVLYNLHTVHPNYICTHNKGAVVAIKVCVCQTRIVGVTVIHLIIALIPGHVKVHQSTSSFPVSDLINSDKKNCE